VTVSTEELMELLQAMEIMVRLGDDICAANTVQDWMQAHRGEARIIHDMSKSQDLFGDTEPDISRKMKAALGYAYEMNMMNDFDQSRTDLYSTFVKFNMDYFLSSDLYKGWALPVRADCVYSLVHRSRTKDVSYSIFMLRSGTRPTDMAKVTGTKLSSEIQKVIMWTREQYLSRQALAYAVEGSFGKAIHALSLLHKRLEGVDMNDPYIYTGLPYVPGPEDEL
jgi:hypothetical protein